MARKGNINGGFEPDTEAGSAQATEMCNHQEHDDSGAEAEAAAVEPYWCLTEPCDADTCYRRREVATQTEDAPITVRSWKILCTQSSEDVSSSSVSLSSDYMVVENCTAGYNASAQTQNAHLFRYSEAHVLEMVIAWQMITLFIPTTWYLVLYVADQASSVAVAAKLCHMGERWWCGLTVTFLILPSFIINAYAYEHIGRKVLWCFRAWRAQSWPSMRRPPRRSTPITLGRTPQELWDQAKAETESSTTKWFHSLLESVPQLSVQSYILMLVLLPDAQRDDQDIAVLRTGLLVSVVVSLTSASSGMASVVSERAWERVAASLAVFLTLGSRVMVCSGVGTVHPMLWFAPVAAATLLGYVTKVSESGEETIRAVLTKTHKYMFDGFVMAVVCPPFDTVGMFSSAPYVLAGLCFLTLDPAAFINIAVFVMSIVGQVIWLAVGFFVTGETESSRDAAAAAPPPASCPAP